MTSSAHAPIVLIPPPHPGSMYTLLLDPPLPRFIAWVPVLCRGLAIFIAVPFVIIILLDIVAYLIARTLHLRPLIMRVPRSPPTGSTHLNNIKTNASPAALSELLPNVSEGESSPLVVANKALDQGMGGALGLGLGKEVKGRGSAGWEVDVEDEEETTNILLRPPTPIEVERETEDDDGPVEPGHESTAESRETVFLGATILSPREIVSPTPTLIDELDTDARYGIDALGDEVEVDKSHRTDDLADDALAGWTGAKPPVVHLDRHESSSSDRHDVHVDEQQRDSQDDIEGDKRGLEPVKGEGRLGEPAVHLGEWEPTDFSAQFKTTEESNKTDQALKDLGDKLAAEEDGIADREMRVDGDEVELDLTMDELRDLLRRAQEYKLEGNSLFQGAEPDLDGAIGSYKAALNLLPVMSLTLEPEPLPATKDSRKLADDEIPEQSGVMELTDDQAEAIKRADEAREAEAKRKEAEENNPEIKSRRDVEREIDETKKAVWGNLGAVWVKKGDDKEAVAACTEALKLDPSYVKVLQRRALAGVRIDSWSSLTTAQEDYTTLTRIMPDSSPINQQARRALSFLPDRIRTQQEKEKDEMLSKLKDLGDGLLGRFGLSTNNFKFDKQEGGGYSMRFER